MKLTPRHLALLLLLPSATVAAIPQATVPLWGTFETSVTNTTAYSNKFRDVELQATFVSPSGRSVPFWGFFDGDGSGGPSRFDATNPPADSGGELSGTTWKLRFMPDEAGTWTYSWSFSDGSKSGNGSFQCTSSGAQPGVLQPHASNFHWFQSRSGAPFFPRVFYTMASELAYDIGVFGPAVYQKAIDRGYNVIETNFFPIWDWNTNANGNPGVQADPHFLLWYQQKPYQGETDDGTVYDTDRMNLFAWKRIEQHMNWLAARKVYVIPFQGFAIKRTVPSYRRPEQWSNSKARWYLKYCMARLAPCYNVLWWNYTWEVNPNSSTRQFGQWLDEFDPWDHLYTTEALGSGDYSDPVYGLVSFEGYLGNNSSVSPDEVPNYYGLKKPLFMAEDYRPLWRQTGQNDAEALDRAWRYICQGAFFAWSEIDYKNWPTRTWDEYFTRPMADYITILYRFLGDETTFAALKPNRSLVDSGAYCLADPANEYVVYKPNGGSFNVTLQAGTYTAIWVDPWNDSRTSAGTVTGPGQKSFSTPSGKHFVLYLKKSGGGSNAPPSVNLTSPIAGTTFTAPATITLDAAASDGDGTIQRVEFFANGTLLDTDTSFPYSYTWNNVGMGSYTLTAKATDDDGAVTISPPVSVTVNAPPPPSGLVSGLSVGSGEPYEWFTMAAGEDLYIDRSYAYSAPVPAVANGQITLRTANDDKFSPATTPDFITFTANQDATVFVLYTLVNTTLEADWLNGAGGWGAEGFTVATTLAGAESDRRVRSRFFTGGNLVELGGNGATSGTSSMYTVVVVPGNVTGIIDADGDGLPDSWENAHFGDLRQTPGGDFDADGLTNLEEFNAGTDPTLQDTDGDGFDDAIELAQGTNPLDAASYPGSGGGPPPTSGGKSSGSSGCGATGLEVLLLLGLPRRRKA